MVMPIPKRKTEAVYAVMAAKIRKLMQPRSLPEPKRKPIGFGNQDE